MDKLNPCLHSAMTIGIVKKLNQNKIFSIKDFLQEDVEKLSNITTLDIPCILNIRESIFKKYASPLINGSTLLSKYFKEKRYLETGIKSLDAVLNGGIPVGYITEICGLAGSGKSQLCMQLAINCVKNSENTVLYIDTKGDFSATRIQKALDLCGVSHKDMAIFMFKVKVVNIWSMEELINLLEEVKNQKNVLESLALIIVDSLPCLMFQHFGDDNKIGLKLLNIFTNHARYISTECEIAFVCVNIATRWIDQDIVESDDDPNDCPSSKDNVYVEKTNRCLGKYWKHIPLLVLFLEKPISSTCEEHSVKINLSVHNYNSVHSNLDCYINISPTGVT